MRAVRGDVLLSPVGTAFCPQPDFKYARVTSLGECNLVTQRLRERFNTSYVRILMKPWSELAEIPLHPHSLRLGFWSWRLPQVAALGLHTEAGYDTTTGDTHSDEAGREVNSEGEVIWRRWAIPFLRVHWVAVPEALRARRVNRRTLSADELDQLAAMGLPSNRSSSSSEQRDEVVASDSSEQSCLVEAKAKLTIEMEEEEARMQAVMGGNDGELGSPSRAGQSSPWAGRHSVAWYTM
jgi:hypothetical protein